MSERQLGVAMAVIFLVALVLVVARVGFGVGA